MKKKLDDLSEDEKMQTLDMLYTASGSVSGRNATKEFLKDLLTPSERIMLGRRIWIARMLLQGHTQADIGEQLKVGPNTIWRVQRWLEDQLPGYEEAIAGLELEMKKRKRNAKNKNPVGLAALKRRYPMHFLLFPLKK